MGTSLQAPTQRAKFNANKMSQLKERDTAKQMHTLRGAPLGMAPSVGGSHGAEDGGHTGSCSLVARQ